MNIRTVLPAVAATVMMTLAGAATAQGSSTEAATIGAAEASVQQHRDDQNRRDRNRDRRHRNTQQVMPNQSSTYGAGQVVTTRDGARATVATGGQASGMGSTSASSTVDAYGETTRDGSNADIYGASTANANEPRPERRRPQ